MTRPARRMPGAVLLVIALASVSPAGVPRQNGATAPACQPAGPLRRLPGVAEASGVAMSRLVPGRLWTHNDSGAPLLFALDARGIVTARTWVAGPRIEDWEAIAVGPCPTGSCIYVGDIGDNYGVRKHVSVYRFPEPVDAKSSVSITEAFHAVYPDGPRDAETLLVTPDGRISIVTKGDPGSVAVYRFPRELHSGTIVQLERVGKPRDPGKTRRDDRITDGTVSPDGTWVVLRSRSALFFYRTAELMAGTWREVRRVDLTPLGEPQGEGVAFGDEKTLYVTGESGSRLPAGTFGVLTCGPGGSSDRH
jgi:hypothetical protein